MFIDTELYAQDQEQDVAHLQNGSIIHGDIVEVIPEKKISIQTKDGNLFVYDMKDADKIEIKKRSEEKPNLITLSQLLKL